MRVAQILMFASGLNFSLSFSRARSLLSLTSHTILVNDGNLNKMQMATKCFHLLMLGNVLCTGVTQRERQREEIRRERKQALVMPFAMLKVVHEEKFNFNEFFMT